MYSVYTVYILSMYSVYILSMYAVHIHSCLTTITNDNSLTYILIVSSIHRHPLVPNSFGQAVLLFTKLFHQITSMMKKLHWVVYPIFNIYYSRSLESIFTLRDKSCFYEY